MYMIKKLQKFVTGALCLALVMAGQSSSAQIATIGTGTTASGLLNPVSVGGSAAIGAKNSRSQVTYTVAQLNAAGITGPKLLDSLAWQVQTVPAAQLKNYTIKGKLYAPTNLSPALDNAGFTTLATLPTFQPPLGYVWIPFSTPLYWDGVNNIVFDICSDTVNVSFSGKCFVTTTPADVVTTIYTQNALPLCGATATASVVTSQPNIKMSFRNAPACAGVPATLTIAPAGPLTNCINQAQLLQVTNTINSGGTFQWQKSVDGGPWQNVTAGTTTVTSGAGNGYMANYGTGVNNIQYKVTFTCAATSQSVTSNAVTLNTAFTPVYASLPYNQNFENWINECNVTDAPDSSWVNLVAMGPFSWRREDQGAAGGWTSDIAPASYNPPSTVGSHSARVQTAKGPGEGSLLLHVNCQATGGKELRLDYQNKTGQLNKLIIMLSTDGGTTYTNLDTFVNQGVTGSWQPRIVQIPSSSPTTVIRFRALSVGMQSGDYDMGIDNVRIYDACTATPVAGTVDSVTACVGTGVTLGLTGQSAVAGLTWLWEASTNGISWSTFTGGNVEHPTPILNAPTWYRCTVTCVNSGLSNTTVPRLIGLSPLYKCYCSSLSTIGNPGTNIGNVQLSSTTGGPLFINNGNPLPALSNTNCNQHYNNYDTLAPGDLYMDSTYKLKMTFISRSASMSKTTNKVYIDWNINGSFDAGEQVMSSTKAANILNDSVVITVPSTATVGITRMRVITNDQTDTTTWGPCTAYQRGETEDYLIRVWQSACTGTPLAGTITVSDTLACPGYPFSLTNSNFDSTSSMITRTWQQSADATTWTDIAGSNNQSTFVQNFSTPMWYRSKSYCNNSATAAYSNEVKVNKFVSCYCVSYADGGFAGAQDSSDIGSFVFGTINIPLTGGHLNNPDAVSRFTNRTSLAPVVLWADSTYNFSLDHIILRNDHMDAKITMFIDYNANGTYDIPQERVYSAMSTETGWQKTGTITIPSSPVVNTVTGLRIVINNDTAANTPSDEACGIYTSGETEDYVVKFRKATPPPPPNGITETSKLIQSIHIFPNPAANTVQVQYNGKPLDRATLSVKDVTGSTLETKALRQIKEGDIFKIDMSKYAKGIYFIMLEANGDKAVGKAVLQ